MPQTPNEKSTDKSSERIVPQVNLDNLNDVAARKRLTLVDGDLSKLQITNIFRLVKVSGANCRILITAPDGEAITFDIIEGSLARASSAAYRLSDYLLDTTAITPLDIYEASERARATEGRGKFLTALLATKSPDFFPVLIDLLTRYIHTIFFRAARLTAGTFRIDYNGDVQQQVLPVKVDLEPVLRQSAIDIMHWQEAMKVLPNDNIALEINPALPPNVKQVTLTADDWQLLAQFNGRRSLLSVLVKSGLPVDRAVSSLRKVVTNKLTKSVEPVSGLEMVVLQREPMSASKSMPGDLQSNLIYKKIDGQLSLSVIQKQLGLSQEDLVERCYMMVKSQLVSVREGGGEFRNLVEQIVVLGKGR